VSRSVATKRAEPPGKVCSFIHLYFDVVMQLKEAKEGVVSAGKVAYRYLFGERASSGIGSDSGLSESGRMGSSDSSRRFSFSRTPSRVVGRTSVDSSEEDNMQTVDSSRVEKNGSNQGFMLWKEPSLHEVEGSKS
jgi:hypothetical protein